MQCKLLDYLARKSQQIPEEVAGVEYGTTAKAKSRGAAQKTGTDALKININPGTTAGTGSGGLNV